MNVVMDGDDQRRRFDALYAEHVAAVYAYARRRTDAASSDDVVAEVFLVAWRRIGEVPSEPRPWLLGIARKALANHARSDRRRLALSRRLADERPELESVPRVGELDPALAAALGRLPALDRELVCLIAWERLTREQAARALGCSRAAVRLRLHRARRRLQRELQRRGAGAAELLAANPTEQGADR